MVATSGNNQTIDLDFLQGLASEITEDQKFGQAAGGDYLSRAHNCQLCHQTFSTSKMLQAHNQTAHADKTFVCEICGKAFRFRSNLAEHRSVHTAVKPFVCKYCGKSSRLKGNLTKHILKHHKMEQIDCIGKDDIIIKKGKKSVKDPAAIDFLEKSMIVLQNAAQAARFAQRQHHVSGQMSSWEERSSSETGTPSGGLLVDEEQRSTSSANGLDAVSKGGFLTSFGLDDSTLDLKQGADESPDDSCVGTSRASSMNLGDFQQPQGLQTHTANDQLLERCKMEIDEEEDQDEEEDEHNSSVAVIDAAVDGDGGVADKCINEDDNASGRASSFASMLNSASNGNSRTPNNTVAMAAAACKAILFGNMAAAAAANAKRSNLGQNFEDCSNDDGDDTNLIGTMKRTMPNSSVGGPMRSSSQCPECGKHLRKPRDLITHLATMHNISPNSALSNGGTSSSLVDGNTSSNSVSAIQELRNLQRMMGDLKNTSQNISPNDYSGMIKVNQTVVNLDARVGRLEKQVEMALNSIYTLVQLQTGINNQMTRFRDETGDQLRNVINILSDGKAAARSSEKSN